MKRPTTKRQADTPEPAAAARTPETPARPADKLVERSLRYIEQQIDQGNVRPTISDLIKLLQIREAASTTKRIVAAWYNPNAPEGDCPTCGRALTCPKCGHTAPTRRPTPREQPGSE